MSKPHTFPVRIYYEDTDFSGNVYHAAYLKFMERARTEFLRQRHVHHSELAEQGIVFVVRHMDIWYDRPARIDDHLQVVTRLEELKGARMTLKQTVMRSERVLVRASVEVVAISLDGRPLRLPAVLINALRAEPGAQN